MASASTSTSNLKASGKRKSKNRQEERASGISPEVTEIDKLLDELIELFDTATQEQKAAQKEKADKAALDAEKGLEMRRRSLESMGESVKRKSNDGDDGKIRQNGGSTAATK
eukprot:gene13443-14826_t